MVIVEVATPPAATVSVDPCGLNEHTGGIVTRGEIVAQESVTPPVGLAYPFVELMLMVPSAPFPAGTLLGAMVRATVIVN